MEKRGAQDFLKARVATVVSNNSSRKTPTDDTNKCRMNRVQATNRRGSKHPPCTTTRVAGLLVPKEGKHGDDVPAPSARPTQRAAWCSSIQRNVSPNSHSTTHHREAKHGFQVHGRLTHPRIARPQNQGVHRRRAVRHDYPLLRILGLVVVSRSSHWTSCGRLWSPKDGERPLEVGCGVLRRRETERCREGFCVFIPVL